MLAQFEESLCLRAFRTDVDRCRVETPACSRWSRCQIALGVSHSGESEVGLEWVWSRMNRPQLSAWMVSAYLKPFKKLVWAWTPVDSGSCCSRTKHLAPPGWGKRIGLILPCNAHDSHSSSGGESGKLELGSADLLESPPVSSFNRQVTKQPHVPSDLENPW